jgi:RHS repeat-associated protein
MDTNLNANNNLFNIGLDANLHPLLAPESILPTTSLLAPLEVSALRLTAVNTIYADAGVTNPNNILYAPLSQTITSNPILNSLLNPPSLNPPAPLRSYAPAALVIVAPPQPTHNFAIQAGGMVTFNGKSDLDGNPLDSNDDAFVYAGKGFTLNGESVLPVVRDSAGKAIKNSQGKLQLLDQALVVASGYLQSNVSSNNNYTNLNPPQVIATQSIVVPSFASIKQQELTNRTPVGAVTVTFSTAPTSAQFPSGGTATQPKVIRINNGNLVLPKDVNLSNSIIIVENGDINFTGKGNLTNVVLVANNGNINLDQIETENSSFLAAKQISANKKANLGGKTLLASGIGDITFNGEMKGTNSLQSLNIISQGRITFNGKTEVRGNFRSAGTFSANGNADIYGTVASQQDIFFNGSSTFTYTNTGNNDTTAPTITAKLAVDSGISNSDKITNERTISGKIADVSPIATFKAGFDTTPTASWVNVTANLQADGSFTFTPTQLNQIYGGNLSEGTHILHLSATDVYGNQSSFDYSFTLDTTIATPTLQLAIASDTGASTSDKITKINTPTITGTGEIGATIKLNDGNVLVGQATVGNDGKWQIVSSVLTNGNHSLIATATDIAGNISTASTPLNLVIDALLPQLTLSTPLTQTALKNDAKLIGTIDGTGSNLVGVNYRWDNSTTSIAITPNSTGGFNQGLDFTDISNGSHNLTITATDIAGNILTSNYSVNVDLDKEAPLVNLQLVSDTGSNISDNITNNPTITGRVTDVSGVSAVTVSLNTNLNNSVNIITSLQADGTFSLDKTVLTQLNGGQLPDGNYQVYLQAIDNYGNTTTPQTLAFQLLTQSTIPTNLQLLSTSDTGTSNSDVITNNNQPILQGNGKVGDTIQLLDGNVLVGQTTVANDGTWQITSGILADGTHNLTATATDIAGNISANSSSLNLNIDTVIPNLQLAGQLAGIVLNGSSTLKGEVTDANITTISYQFDGGNPITLPTSTQFDTPFDFTGINDGGHNLTVTATDIAGNTVSRTYGVTVARGTLLTIALLNDTGISNSDGITSDINVRGQVADRTQISRLEFALDGSTNYADLTVVLQLDGTFRLLPAQLNSLAGGTLNLGAHSLNVRGVLTDGTPVATATLNFTYQSANLNRPSLTLTKPSDTGVIGDLVTSATTVDLVAKAASGSSITLGNRTLVADVNGVATFTGVNLTLGGNNFTLTTTASNGETATSSTTITRTNPDDVILTWNHIALDAIRRENTPPPGAARLLGMVHTAMYDAVNAIEQKYGVYRVDTNAAAGADEIAAAAQAAARILLAIYPNQQAYINAALESSLLNGATAAASAAGIAVGNTVAANILAWRQQDGARNPASYNPSTEVGKWQPDLPNYDGALLPQWGKVTTFGLTSGSQFRPTGVPSLTSAEYTAAFEEVKTYGARDSQARSADETQSALFWADGNGTYTPPGHWNDIAATAASLAGKSVLDNARVFAQLNVALADAGIAAWDAKYTYNTWRPITAIRQADKDGNPLTSADPNWVPLINTPPFPEYVSGHSTFSGAAAAVLTNAFGSNFSFNSGSTGLPDTTRSFTSFDAAAAEAGQSRIYGGIHFQFANRDGLTLGKQIGDYVTTNLMADNSQNPIQVSLTTDTAAFGTTNRDRITNSAGVTGKVTLTQPNLKLQVGIAGGAFVDVTSSLDASGNFQLDAAKLTTIVGTLTDKAYQLTFKLVDVNGAVVGSNNLSFTLDTTAAQATLNPLTGTVTPTVHVTGTATDGNGGSSGRFKVDGGNWTSFSVQPNGTFDKVVNPQGLTVGVHQVAVEIADLAGNVTAQSVSFTVDNTNNISTSPATSPGWGRVFGTGFSLAEGNSLVTQNTINVALGGSGKRTLDFDLAANFDKSDVKSFGKDRVAVYLVDSNNQPIALDSTHPGGVPLFSLSETGSEIIPGLVKFDGTHVQIDVSNVTATSGKLVVQLLNQDGDSGSNVTVTNFVDAIDPNGTRGTSVNPAITPVTPGAAKILDSYMATNNAQLLLSNVSLDKATGKYTADLRVQNVGTTTLSQNLAVLLTNLPTGVTVANSSGTHPAGSAYLNFDTAIAPGGLAGGAISDAVRVVINDPSFAAFSFKPVVLQGAAAPLPDLSSLATLTVKVGDKIDIPLQGELAIKAGSKLPTGAITGDSHLVFAPAPDQVGSYTFTLIARNGGAEVTQDITLNVVADPITTTRVTGTIATIDQAGLAGVLVELSGYQATTDSSGKFTIVLPESSAGDTLKIYGQRIQGGGITYPFIAEKMGLLLGHDIYRGVNNQIDRPIYLPTIDVTTGTTVNPAVSTVVSNPKLGGAKVTVAANSLFDKSGNAFAGIMSITEVPVTLTPAALPDNLFPDLVVTVQPGDMVFNTPARLSLPNRNNLAAGAELDLWSINPNTGDFDKVGKGRVSADRSVIETISGGIRNSSWHFFALPPFLFDALGNAYNPKHGSPTCPTGMPINSEVILQTGAVVETHNLTTYESRGVTRGISLSYNSLRADVRPIIHFNSDNVNPNLIGENLGAVRLVAKLKVTGDNGFSYQVPGYAGGRNLKGGENFWSIPAGGGRVDAALQADLRTQDSGLYEYTLDSGILGFGPGGNFFGSTFATKGKVLIVNSVDSAFGSGWSLNGLQSIVTNKDGSILLIDGDGHELLFDAPLQPGGKYINPTGEFSTLERLGDGTYRRTLKDGTVYQFNTDRQLANMSDRQGNSTQYRYDASGNLTQMVDPTGLTTNFNYTGNRITSIVDPAGRTTKMEYDANGNLIKLTDPDGTYRRWEYDADHHMTAAIDKTGGRGEDFYDFAGRAYKGIRPDGSQVLINPIEVQGLYRPDSTKNPNTAPIATALAAKPIATYLDGNGNPLVGNIDKYGQTTAAVDGVGKLTTTTRNQGNLVTETTSATGGKIGYTYDERGNVIATNELIVQPGTLGDSWTPPHALSLNGTNNYAQLSQTALVANLPNSTVDMWVKFNKLGNNYQTLYSEDSSIGAMFAVGYNKGYLDFGLWRAETNWRYISAAFNTVNEWVHITSVVDSTKGISLYINGELVASSPDGKPSNGTIVNAQLGRITNTIAGQAGVNAQVSGSGYFDGKIADVKLWGVALSQADIKAGVNRQLTGTEPGLVDYWKFDEGAGTTARTVTANGKNGTLVNGITWDNSPTPNVPQQLVYSNDFETLVGPEWSLKQVESSAPALSKFLGRFGNNTETLTLDTTPGETYKLNFDLYTIDSWDGNLGGPDYFNVAIDGTQVFRNTFSYTGTNQTFRAPERIANLGFQGAYPEDIYRGIPLTFTATGNTTKINFSGSGLQPLFDESWGIDNVRVNQLTGLSPAVAPINVQRQYTYDTKFNQLTSVTDELGRKILYDLDTNTGNILKSTRIVGQLDSTINGETNDIATSYTYTSTGQLNTVTDALGHITDYDYNSLGRLIKTTAAEGTVDQIVEQYEYDLAGNQTTSIDPLGHRTKYIYNSTNMLLQSIDALGGTTTYNYDKMGHRTSMTDALGHVTKMTYDSRGRLISTLDANGGITRDTYDNNGNLLSVTDALGRISKYQYDARNRLIGMVAADGGITSTKYDLNNNPIRSVDALGQLTKQIYDSRNRLVSSTDAVGNLTKYSYDAANELVSTTDAKGHITTYQYDELGRQISTTDALGHITRTEYDKLGNVTAIIDANGNRTEYSYNNLNRRIQVKDAIGGLTKTSYDKVGDVLSVTDALSRTTSYAYDALNRQISVTDALNHTSNKSYDAVGNVISTTDALLRTTSYIYDNLNRKVSAKDALGQTQFVSYDLVGNVLTQTDELGHVTSFGYDNVNRQTTITNPLGQITTTSYDSEGNVTSTKDSLNNITRYLYDNNNRQIQVIDAKGGITKTSYDAVGNISTISDSVNNVTSYGYDAIDRLISDTNQLGKTRTRSYDNVGNLTQTVDRNGRKVAYNYDTLNRQTAERWLDNSNATIKTFSSSYDAIGHLLSSTNPDSAYTYSYDAVDRILSIDNTGTVSVPTVKFNYSYDAVGNLVAVNDSINGTNAGITGYSYDLLNRVTGLTQSGTGVQSKRVAMAYNAVNQLTSLSRYSGTNSVVDTNYTYDNNQRLIKLAHVKGGTTVASYDYSYDNADKLASTVSSVDGTSNYSYDATNQLTGASHTSQVNEAYSYDANGNRVSGGTVTGVNNQLLSDGVYNYTYDGEGNRTRRVEIGTGKVTEYVWDYRNRLASVLFKDAGGVVSKTIDYIYDGNNQRTGKRIDGAVTERYVIDRNQIALVFDGAGVQTHRYLYGTQIDQVLADETATATNWFLADNQGTVRDVVDSNGTVIDHINYDSFGKVQSQSNAGYDLRFGYTGREQDGETGLDYYRARYYDASVGRFISEDPLGFGAGDGNLTRYVGNSPVNFNDPNGLQEEEINIPKILWDAFWGFVEGATKKPVPPLVEPLPIPIPLPRPEVVPLPNPNCPKKKTCKSEYPEYSTIIDINNAKYSGIDGFKFNSLYDAKIELEQIKRDHSDPLYRPLKDRGKVIANGKLVTMGERYFEESRNYGCNGPSSGRDRPMHYNAITFQTSSNPSDDQVSGGSLGFCKICTDSDNGPILNSKYIVLNVKNKSGRNPIQTR